MLPGEEIFSGPEEGGVCKSKPYLDILSLAWYILLVYIKPATKHIIINLKKDEIN